MEFLGVLGILIILLWLVSVAGHFWLLFFAYKQSRMWALAVFFLSPIAAILFARKYWEVSKRPFLVYATSFCSAIALTVFMTYSSIGVELSKVKNQADFAKNMASLQKLVQSTRSLENLDSASAQMAQQPNNEDGQKFHRLMSEYVRYKESGLTDRSRRYLTRNARELLLLTELTPVQGTRLTELVAEIEGDKAKIALPSQDDSEQVRPSTSDEGPATKHLKDFKPPPPFLIEASELASEAGQKKQRLSKANQPESAHKKSEHVPWDVETLEDRSPIKKISFREAKQYIGLQITFLNLSDVEQKCFLVEVSQAGLECEKRFQSGTFSTLYSRSEVKSLRVTRNSESAVNKF